MARLNIVTYGCERCTGFCAYCSARIAEIISQGFDLNDVKKSLQQTNERTYRESKWDFEKLEKRMLTHPLLKEKGGSVTLWGADPLSSFYCLQENVDFIKYFNKKYDYKLRPGFCTNGLGLLMPEWVEYLIKENIGFTLSHDGLGQEIRTLKPEFDPIYFDGFKEVVDAGLCRAINTVLNQYNSDPIANYDYYVKKLPKKIKNIRFSRVLNGLYDVRTPNKNGLCNGKYYNELKGKPYGDFLIHNDYGNEILSRQLDIYIDGYKKIYSNIDKYPRISLWLIRNAFANSITNANKKNQCYKYQTGEKSYSCAIDTIGNDCDCMLFDGRKKAEYVEEKAEYCEGCEYYGRYECRQCGTMKYPKKDNRAPRGCKFAYRYQQLMDFANRKIDQYEENYNGVYIGPRGEKGIREYRRYNLLSCYKKEGIKEVDYTYPFSSIKRLYIENPYGKGLSSLIKRANEIIYDRSDNWSARNEYGRKIEDEIFKCASVIINSSKYLYEDSIKKAKNGASILYIPNASKKFKYIEQEKYKNKTAVYIGNSMKCDYELIVDMANEYPEWNFLIYTNNEYDDRDLSFVRNATNIELLKSKKLEELFKVLCKCHVGLITLNKDYASKEYLDGQLPDKLFNYINAKLPVIYNNVNEQNIDDYKEVCFKYKSNILNEIGDISNDVFEKLERSWDDVFAEYKMFNLV